MMMKKAIANKKPSRSNARFNNLYVRSNAGHIRETRLASDETLRGTNSERR